MALHLFAGVRVRDFRVVRPWYEQLLGEPTFLPHAAEAVWTLAEDRSLYVVEHADGAGKSVATIFLDGRSNETPTRRTPLGNVGPPKPISIYGRAAVDCRFSLIALVPCSIR
jgi:hypothetical protein